MDYTFIYYAITISLIAIAFTIYLISRLRLIESRRRENLKKRDEYDVSPDEFTQSVDSKEMEKSRLNALTSKFGIFRRIILIAIWATALMLVVFPLWQSQSPFLASFILAASSVIIGIAAKPIIENLICGTVLAFGKLARIGDTVVVDGEYGIVEKMTATHCVIKRWDWLRYVIPNSTMMNKEFVNYSLYDNYRWVYVEFWIDYSADLGTVEKIALDAPRKSQYCSDEEDTHFWVVEMDKDAVKCMAVAWATQPSDGWMLSIHMRTELMRQFQENSITTHRLQICGIPNVPPTDKNRTA